LMVRDCKLATALSAPAQRSVAVVDP